MPSFLSWLDYDEAERQRTQDALALFREQDTRDEIGIGVIRDALADRLFPGTSTIQTRVRYFLFIPWIYRQLESENLRTRDAVEDEVRKSLSRLREGLSQSADKDGIIGGRAGFHVQRLPDSVYWQGLIRWGILQREIARESYWQILSRQVLVQEVGEEKFFESIWSETPKAPDEFPKNASFAVTEHEAEYLQRRIKLSTPSSLLDYLAERPALFSTIREANYAWELSDYIDNDNLKNEIDHARRFSITIQGARLLYNFMLAEQRKDAARIDHYQQKLDEWMDENPQQLVEEWDIVGFFSFLKQFRPTIANRAIDFVNHWLVLIRSEQAQSDAAKKLISDREATIKGKANARLWSQRALELWSGASGAVPLDFRWASAKRFLLDIHEALNHA